MRRKRRIKKLKEKQRWKSSWVGERDERNERNVNYRKEREKAKRENRICKQMMRIRMVDKKIQRETKVEKISECKRKRMKQMEI